jgi:c-di-GMP-binding flagellar brake protein YcgR
MSTEQSNELKAQEYEFEAMNLQVGGRLQFITHRQVKPVQHFSTLIGYIKDEYLIVKIPMENGAPIALTEGERLTIRVFSGINVCSFACTVERVFPRPLLYVHLSFPTSMVNLSVTGALIESPRRLPPDDEMVTLQFTLLAPPRNQEVRVQTRATIRNVNVVKPSPDQFEVFTYGVQFVDLDPGHYTLLQNMTYEALIADRQKIV